jgi:uncharacterized protein YoxC
MDAYQILVIFLSVSLAIFLILAIICLVAVIKVVKKVNLAVDTAKHAVDNVEAMTGSIKNVADGTVLKIFATKAWEMIVKSKSKKGR